MQDSELAVEIVMTINPRPRKSCAIALLVTATTKVKNSDYGSSSDWLGQWSSGHNWKRAMRLFLNLLAQRKKNLFQNSFVWLDELPFAWPRWEETSFWCFVGCSQLLEIMRGLTHVANPMIFYQYWASLKSHCFDTRILQTSTQKSIETCKKKNNS